MNFDALRLPTYLVALASLGGCMGAVDSDVEQDSASLSRGGDRVIDADRLERCTRDWDCRPGDVCLAPDGDDRGDRADVQECGREPDFACNSDRECERGTVCGRDGNCRRLREDKDECRNAREFRAIARRIRNAVANGTMRPAEARHLWQRLMNAVDDRCGREVRAEVLRDEPSRDDGGGRDDGGDARDGR